MEGFEMYFGVGVIGFVDVGDMGSEGIYVLS